MKTEEEIIEFTKKLSNTLTYYLEDDTPTGIHLGIRICGGIEACLIVLGFLEPDQTIEYEDVEYKSFFGRKKTRKETYYEYLIRKVKELL